MRHFFISTAKPPEYPADSDYWIDPAIYACHMQQKWSDARIIIPSGEVFLLAWYLKSGLSGGLHRDQHTVNFGRNPVEDAVEFVLWYRAYIPSEQSLFLFTEELNVLALTTDCSETAIRAFLD